MPPIFLKALQQRTRAGGSSFSSGSSASRHLSSLPRRATNPRPAGPFLRAARQSALIASRAPRLHRDSAFRSEGPFALDYNTFLARRPPRVASRTSRVAFRTWCDTFANPKRERGVSGPRKSYVSTYPPAIILCIHFD